MTHCSKCFKGFINPQNLLSHEYLKHSEISEESLLICDLCGSKKKIKQLMRDHIRIVHHSKWVFIKIVSWTRNVFNIIFRTKRDYVCNICGRTSKTKQGLMKHEKTHSVLNPSEFVECPVCQKSFKQKFHLKKHIKVVHERLETWVS